MAQGKGTQVLDTIATDLRYTSSGWPTGSPLAFALTVPGKHSLNVHFATEQMPDVDLGVAIRLNEDPVLLGFDLYETSATITFEDGETKTVTGIFDSRTGTARFR